MNSSQVAFQMLHPDVQRVVYRLGWSTLRPIQVATIEAFYESNADLLLISPTASGKTEAWLKCIDAAKAGDITTNGLIWSYPLQKHVLGTPAISDGLIFIADCGRAFHCLDADTGKPYWTHEIIGEAWASPLVADGKVYVGTRSGNFYVFAASKKEHLLAALDLHDPISSTATAANGVLYVATMNHLYALKQGSSSPVSPP